MPTIALRPSASKALFAHLCSTVFKPLSPIVLPPCGAMAPSDLLDMKHLAKWTITTYIMAYITAAVPTAAPQEAAMGASTPVTGTFDVAWRIRSSKQDYDDIPNTLSTTAHIHTLLFQPYCYRYYKGYFCMYVARFTNTTSTITTITTTITVGMTGCVYAQWY